MSTIESFFKNPPIIERSEYLGKESFVFPYMGINEEDVPKYFKRIFDDPSISNYEGERFITEFLIKFINKNGDKRYKNYKRNSMGKFLLFVDNKYEKVVDDESEAWVYGTNHNIKQIFYIGEQNPSFNSFGTLHTNNKRYIDNEETHKEVLINDRKRGFSKSKIFYNTVTL